MKARDKARQDIEDILAEMDKQQSGIDDYSRNSQIASKMRARGWRSVATTNVVQTIAGLGFTVVGEHIYGIDE